MFQREPKFPLNPSFKGNQGSPSDPSFLNLRGFCHAFSKSVFKSGITS